MCHAPMGRFQLELIFYSTYSSTVVPSNSFVFLYCGLFVVDTFPTALMGVGASEVTEKTSTPTRQVENVVLTTKGLQERNTQLLDGTTLEK